VVDDMSKNEFKKTSGKSNMDQDIFKEVDKFLKEKEQYIRESIIGARVIEELEEYTLDVGVKKTYLCTKNSEKDAYPTLTKIIENFIQAYGGTAIIYPKGEQICLELITPKINV
jgi:hypothetical protein